MKPKSETTSKPWTVFYPVRTLGNITAFDRFNVVEPTMTELLNGYVYWNRDPKGRRMIRQRDRSLRQLIASPWPERVTSFAGCSLVRFDGGFFLRPVHHTWTPTTSNPFVIPSGKVGS